MAVEGTLDLFKLPEILQLISQQRKTGILTVQGQQDIVAISFLTGRIVAVDALNQTLEEGLAQVLVKERMLSAPDLARAVSEHQAAGGRLLDLLVERRYLERAQLLEALRIQTYRLLEQLLRWNQGDFKFYSGDEVSFEEGFSPISVEELLIRAAQSSPPAAEPARPATLSEPAAAAPRPVAVPAAAPAAAPTRPAVAPAAPPSSPPAAGPAGVTPALGPRPVAKGPRPLAPSRLAPPASRPAVLAELDEGDRSFRRMKVEPRPAPPSLPWVGRPLAGLLAAMVVLGLLQAPNFLAFPYPWQQRDRAELAREQRAALYLKIDHAAKTWFLLKGSFPDRLQDLVASGLLSPSDLVDPEGRPLGYRAGEVSYSLQPLQAGKPVPGTEVSEAITGNFLLDPEFIAVPADSAVQPLVLLD